MKRNTSDGGTSGQHDPKSGDSKHESNRKSKFRQNSEQAGYIKSKLRAEKTGDKLANAKEKLTKQESPKLKPPGAVKSLAQAAGYEVHAKIHGKIHEVEHENVGVEAAHRAELFGETVGRAATRYVKRRIRTRPARQVAKWEKRSIKANADLRFRQMAQENPGLNKNAFKRHLQKRRLQKQYQKQAKEAAKNGAKKTGEKAVSAAEKAGRAAVNFAKRHPTLLLIAICCFLVIILLQSCAGVAMTVGNGLGGAVGGTSYLSEDNDIDEAELRYTEWETDLELRAKSAENSYPEYDEYRYNIGDIGHNPYELLAFLTAKYDNFTYNGVQGVLRGIFAQQYTLTFTPSVETRYRTETRTSSYTDGNGVEHTDTYEVEVPYDWHVLTVTLDSVSFSDIVYPLLTTQSERERYEVYMFLHGNHQMIGRPFDFEWLSRVSAFYGYRVSPINGAKEYHKGIDIAVPTGKEILAGGAGVVLEAGNNGDYGLTLLIDYGKGVSARYAHCSVLRVGVGQTVALGDVIALSGDTGNSTGPHLHMEVIKNGRYLNPLFFVDGTQGDEAPGSPGNPGGPDIPDYPGEPMDDPAYAALIAEAEKHLGKAYVFGASGPNNFDCSGFICWIFTHSGVRNLPRTTAQGIFNQCTPLSRANARPGDLIFFTKTYSTPNMVTHIGLYVGNGMMIHCGDPCKYSSTDTPYFQEHFYSFGRLSGVNFNSG